LIDGAKLSQGCAETGHSLGGMCGIEIKM